MGIGLYCLDQVAQFSCNHGWRTSNRLEYSQIPILACRFTMPLLTITQGHLKLLEDCPRRFQYVYRQQLSTPTSPAMLASQEWGNRFHLIMQQRQLGLQVDALLAGEPELAAAVRALETAAPELFQSVAGQFHQSEHRRSLAFNGYVLTVIYDLLLLTADQGTIVDWKTYLQPLQKTQLRQDWQTRLYLYLLVETTDLSPNQVDMVYWFVRHQDRQTGGLTPQPIRLTYSRARHRQTGKDLQRLTTYLQQMEGQPLPQVPMGSSQCDRCPFAVRCQRPSQRYDLPPSLELPSLEEIAEVPL